jgi:hypothetical protein
MTNHHAVLHKLQSVIKTGFVGDDWIVGVTLAIGTSLCVVAVLLLSQLFLMSQG